MTTEAQPDASGATEESTESRSYLEIKTALESGAEGSADDETTKTPEPTGAEPGNDDESEQDDDQSTEDSLPQFNTVEEARKYIADKEKEWKEAQTLVGRQGQELGEIRQEIAALKTQGTETKTEESTEEKVESYVERFKNDKTFEGMNEKSREYMGHMFDYLKEDLLKEMRKAPELQQVSSQLNQMQMQEVQKGWTEQGNKLRKTYGKELVEKHTDAVAKIMEQEWSAGRVPNVETIFNMVASDDIIAHKLKTTQADTKDQLNKQAGLQQTRKAPPKQTQSDYSGLDKKEAFKKMLEEDKAKGLIT